MFGSKCGFQDMSFASGNKTGAIAERIAEDGRAAGIYQRKERQNSNVRKSRPSR